jgi:hypothetical protein
MYNSAAAVCADFAAAGVAVVECPLQENACMCLARGGIVAVDSSRFATQREKVTALIHEEGHFMSGAFYVPFSAYHCPHWWKKCGAVSLCGRLQSILMWSHRSSGALIQYIGIIWA